MKFTIDTEKKTIKILEDIKLSDLYSELENMGIKTDFVIRATEIHWEYMPYYPVTYPSQPSIPYPDLYLVTYCSDGKIYFSNCITAEFE